MNIRIILFLCLYLTFSINSKSQTQKLTDLFPNLISTSGIFLSPAGGNIYFIGQENASDSNLFEYSQAYGLRKITGSFLPSRYMGVSFYFQNAVYFLGWDSYGVANAHTYKYDGTGDAQIVNKLEGVYTGDATAIYHNKVFFIANQNLYSYDGTDTVKCAENLGTVSSNFGIANDTLYFFRNNTGTFDLCKYDGQNIIFQNYPDLYNIQWVISYDNNIYFNNRDNSSGYQVWKYEGTDFTKVTDIGTPSNSLSPSMFSNYKDLLCFVGTDDFSHAKIWLYNKSCNKIIPITDYSNSSGYANTKVIDTDGTYLYFTYKNGNPDGRIKMYYNSIIQDVPFSNDMKDPLTIAASYEGLFFSAFSTTKNDYELFYYASPAADPNTLDTNACNISGVSKSITVNKSINIIPNPTTGRFSIDSEDKIVEIIAYDALGKSYKLTPDSYLELTTKGIHIIYIKTMTGKLYKEKVLFE